MLHLRAGLRLHALLRGRRKNRVASNRSSGEDVATIVSEVAMRSLSKDYARVEAAIHYLDRHFPRQPDLAEVARSLHLSPFHFQRMFRRWAGISPKRFLQYLSLDYAKRALSESGNVLDAAYAAGLSSPARLHDLMVNLEAVTPGEFRLQGAGAQIAWGIHPTPFGECLLAVTARGISDLIFFEKGQRDSALHALRRRWPKATLKNDSRQTKPYIHKLFAPVNHSQFSLFVKGTNFQIKVWEALLRIPPGAVATYEGVATLAGFPRAARATGRAIADNPIAFLIPCHRVIRKTGLPGGYRWGAARKRALLAWERARFGAPETLPRD